MVEAELLGKRGELVAVEGRAIVRLDLFGDSEDGQDGLELWQDESGGLGADLGGHRVSGELVRDD